MAWAIEYTDTFAGEANYSWVRRATLGARRDESQASVMRRAKAALGLTGLRGDTESYGDAYTFRPRGMCTVLFVTWSDWREEDTQADAAELRRRKRSSAWRTLGRYQVKRELGTYSDGSRDGRAILYVRKRGVACAVVSTPYPGETIDTLQAFAVLVGTHRLTPNPVAAANLVRQYLERSL